MSWCVIIIKQDASNNYLCYIKGCWQRKLLTALGKTFTINNYKCNSLFNLYVAYFLFVLKLLDQYDQYEWWKTE